MFRKYYIFITLFLLISPFFYGQQPENKKTYHWTMVTVWPENMPIFQDSAEKFARDVEIISNGRIKIQVYAYGQLKEIIKKNSLEDVFDAVSDGMIEMAHSAPYYWSDKIPGCEFFSTIPFGLGEKGMYAWLYIGGGLALWREIYEPYDIIPFPIGNTGPAMGGWFNKKIEEIEDFKNLKMRIAGFGGEVLKRAGVKTVLLPASDIFDAFERKDIDAAVFQGPYHDQWLKLNRAAKYYYYPGWHEPGTVIELIINKTAWNSLTDDLKKLMEAVIGNNYKDTTSQFDSTNYYSIQVMKAQGEIQLKEFPLEVLGQLRLITEKVLENESKNSSQFKKIYDTFKKFRKSYQEWKTIREKSLELVKSEIMKTKIIHELKYYNFATATSKGNKYLTISLIGDASFNPGSTKPKHSMKTGVSRIAQILTNHSFNLVTIEGHTDNIGNKCQNIILSLNRAKSVAQIMIHNGINPSKVRTIPYGDSQPIAPNQTEESRRKNRRVEIVIEFE